MHSCYKSNLRTSQTSWVYWHDVHVLFHQLLKFLFIFQEFSPGTSGRKTTMGVYVRDLLLGQVRLKQSLIPCSIFRFCYPSLQAKRDIDAMFFSCSTTLIPFSPVFLFLSCGRSHRIWRSWSYQQKSLVRQGMETVMDLMIRHAGHHLWRQHFQSLLVSVLLIVHQPGIRLLFVAQYLPPPMTEPVMIHEVDSARVVNILIKNIQTGIGIRIGVEKGTVIGIERGTGFGIGIRREKRTGIVKGIGIRVGTETGIGKGIDTEGMIMIEVPGTLIGKAEGILNRAAVTEVGIIEKVVLIEAAVEAGVAAGAGAGAEARKLAHHHLIAIQLLKGMETRIRHLRLAIWLSSKIFIVILVIRKGMLAWKGFLGGIMMVKRFLDSVVPLGGR